jgi:hypothetical protein
MRRLLTAIAILMAALLPRHALAGTPHGYSVVRTSQGMRLTLRFARRDEPRHALVAVTATLMNLSNSGLTIERSRRPYGPCSWPAISLQSINAKGRIVEPSPPIQGPVPSCPAPQLVALPVGSRVVEHQMIVLWTSRLQVDLQIDGQACDCQPFGGVFVRLHLHAGTSPRILVQNIRGFPTAAITRPPGATGQMYYRSWGDCGFASSSYDWTALTSGVLSAGCTGRPRWHLDVGWLNSPIASLNYGT